MLQKNNLTASCSLFEVPILVTGITQRAVFPVLYAFVDLTMAFLNTLIILRPIGIPRIMSIR